MGRIANHAVGILLLIFAIAAGCSGVRVSQDYLDTAGFAGLQTYAWRADVQQKTGKLQVDNPLLARRIHTAVDLTLSDGGYRRVSGEPADFRVDYELDIRSKLESHDTGFGFGFGRFSRHAGIGIGVGSEVETYDEALLVISVYDPPGEAVLWRGIGTRRVSEHYAPDQLDRMVDEMVNKILAQFPPL